MPKSYLDDLTTYRASERKEQLNMREIKFRAWDIESQLMIEERYFAQLVDGKTIGAVPKLDLLEKHDPTELVNSVRYHGNPFTMHTLIKMQYTGLCDKNGVEIYEGDVLAFYSTDLSRVTKRQAVCWEPSKLGYNITRKPTVEVIGNRFENPELLNDSK